MKFNNKQPLYVQIYQDLLKKINENHYKIEKPIPTEKELCEVYNVSRITVQKAVQRLVDEEYIVRRSGVGSFVKKKDEPSTKKYIGVILPSFLESFGATILKCLESECEKKGYFLVIKITNEDQFLEKKYLKELIDLPVQGIIIEPAHKEFYNSVLVQAVLAKFPIVIIDRKLLGIDSLFVGSDHYRGAYSAAEMIFDMGHRHIGIITYTDISNTSLQSRLDAFNDVFSKKNASLESNSIDQIVKSSYFDLENTALIETDITNIQEFIMKNIDSLTCLISLDTHLGSLIQESIHRLGLNIPKDLSFFSFDTIKTVFLSLRYSYLQQDEEKIAVDAVNLLIKAINHEKIPKKQIMIEPHIVNYGTVTKIV